ncbi:MAG: hypothetical protein JXA36_03270 [Coriobacteriia bacterium]|nr:hypothetical protein [Coriobacteriia bacterium]
MDYFGILKKAWNITWRYKALWVLGLFVGIGSGGSGGGSSGYDAGSGDFSGSTGSGADPFAAMERFFADNALLVAVIAGVIVIVGLILWVLSIAAQGGLVRGSNEAAEGRAPSLRDCWSVGFSKWGRTFMTGFVLSLPILVIVLVLITVLVILTVGGFAVGEEAGLAALGGGMCFILPVFIVAAIAASIILGIVYPLALRYGVLEDVTFGQAIKRAWNDLWAKRGAFVMWLVMLLPGIVLSLAMLALMMPFMIPVIAFAIAEKYLMSSAVVVLMMLVMLVPTAIYGTFVSTAWTVFFRQMTGLEPKALTQPSPAPAYAPPAAAATVLPAPAPDVETVPEPESAAAPEIAPEPEPAVAAEIAPEPALDAVEPAAEAEELVPTEEEPPPADA